MKNAIFSKRKPLFIAKKNISLNETLLKKNINLKNKVIQSMAKSKIFLHYHYIPIFMMKKIFNDLSFKKENCVGAIYYYNTSIVADLCKSVIKQAAFNNKKINQTDTELNNE